MDRKVAKLIDDQLFSGDEPKDYEDGENDGSSSETSSENMDIHNPLKRKVNLFFADMFLIFILY